MASPLGEGDLRRTRTVNRIVPHFPGRRMDEKTMFLRGSMEIPWLWFKPPCFLLSCRARDISV